MEERSAGGCVRREASVAASTRPCAASIGISSAGSVETPSKTRSNASSTEIRGEATLSSRAPFAGSAAGFFQQANAFDAHAALGRFHHVVDREAGDRDGGQRLHLDAGLACNLYRRADDEPRQLLVRLDLDLD